MKVLSRDYLMWNLKGRPSFSAVVDEVHRQKAALIDLGFFEVRDFLVNGAPLDRRAEAGLTRLLSGGSFTKGWISFE